VPTRTYVNGVARALARSTAPLSWPMSAKGKHRRGAPRRAADARRAPRARGAESPAPSTRSALDLQLLFRGCGRFEAVSRTCPTGRP